MSALKRSAGLVAVAVAAAALAACSPADARPAADAAAPPIVANEAPPASAAPTAPALPELPAGVAAGVAEYVERFDFSAEPYADTVWLDAETVETEFREATAAFPLALPDGYSWPATSGIDVVSGIPERGSAVAQAYFFWDQATATAAYADHLRGDDDAAAAHLSALAGGYASPLRSMYVDPEQLGVESGYYRGVIAPALQGEWRPLVEAAVEPFLDVPAHAEIAARAGDSL